MRRYWWLWALAAGVLLALIWATLAGQLYEDRVAAAVSHGKVQKSLDNLSTAWYDLVDRAEGAEEEARVADASAAYWKMRYEFIRTDGEACASCVEWHELNHPRLGSEPTALTRNEEARMWKVNSDGYEREAEQWKRTAERWRARALGLERYGVETTEGGTAEAVERSSEGVQSDEPAVLTFTQDEVIPPNWEER